MSNWALHKAIFDALNDIGDWKAYDAVPQGAQFPYVVIDGQLANDAQLLSHPREDVRLYLSVWSRVQGQEEVLRIMRAIKDALHNRRLPLEDGYVVSLTVARALTQKDIEDETYIGHMTFALRFTPGRVPVPSINIPSPWLTNQAEPQIPGTARAGFHVTIYLDGLRAGETAADENGEWLFKFAALASGTYVVTARQSDAAGNKSALSLPLTMIVDTLAPAAPVILTPSPLVTTDRTPQILGTAEADVTITIYLDGEEHGETVADEEGAWSFVFDELWFGDYVVTATATDAAGNTSAHSAVLVIDVEAEPIEISGTPVTVAMETRVYAGFIVSASGGYGDLTYSVSAGTLPAGIALDEQTGVVSGTPEEAGVFAGIAIRATDEIGNFAELPSFTLTVAENLSVSASPVTFADEAVVYPGIGMQATGGFAPLTYTLSGGSLPAGLALNSATGEIEGTPSESGDFDGITITATDAEGFTASLEPFDLTVMFTPASLGDDLLFRLMYWNPEAVVMSGNQIVSVTDPVTGTVCSQAVATQRPILVGTWARADGNDDCHTFNTVSLPVDDEPCDTKIICRQSAPTSDTAQRMVWAYGGGAVNNGRSVSRVVSSGINAARTVIGTGEGNVPVNNIDVDFSAAHVVLQRITGTEVILEVDGIATPPSACVPATGATRGRIFAQSGTNASFFWHGDVKEIYVSKPLSPEVLAKLVPYDTMMKNTA